MNSNETAPRVPFVMEPIDRRDLAATLIIGLISVVVKLISVNMPQWNLGLNEIVVPITLLMAYVLHRARREPEKLDDWGITTPLTPAALTVALLLLAFSIGSQAVLGLLAAGRLNFEPAYVPRMVEYFLSGFAQQFFLCSVGLATLAKLRPFHGLWRLPLIVGLAFSAAHCLSPVHLPGTIIPIQMLTTFPAGAIAAFYFLCFRSIVPLGVIHAVTFVLGYNWVESQM